MNEKIATLIIGTTLTWANIASITGVTINQVKEIETKCNTFFNSLKTKSWQTQHTHGTKFLSYLRRQQGAEH